MTAPAVAMTLAAGFGTRMGRLTANRPKPLLTVGGRALIDHALDRCEEAGVRRAVVNTHYLGGQIRAHLAGRRRPEIVFSPEDEILETGGGVARALPLLGEEPFYVVNADVLWRGPPPLAALAAAWDPARMDALLLTVPRAAARGHRGPGDFFESGGRLARRGDAATAPLVFSGAHIASPALFADAPRGAFSLNLLWDRAIAAGRLFGVAYRGDWLDVGAPEGLALAEAGA